MKLLELPIGSKIKFGKYQVETEEPQDIIWLKIDTNHQDPGYPKNSSTFITEKMIDVRIFDAIEKNNPQSSGSNSRFRYGNNNYKLSNINQFLNSNKEKGNWYVPQHEYDAPPIAANIYSYAQTEYFNHTGFLYYFTNQEIKNLLSTEIKTSKTKIDGYGYETTSCKIFLPSGTEMGFGDINNINEGTIFSYFDSNNKRKCGLTQQALNNSLVLDSSFQNIISYWTRTPSLLDDCSLYYVDSSGAQNNLYSGAAMMIFGIRPLCNLSNSLSLSETVDEDDCYSIVYKQNPKYILFNKGGKVNNGNN